MLQSSLAAGLMASYLATGRAMAQAADLDMKTALSSGLHEPTASQRLQRLAGACRYLAKSLKGRLSQQSLNAYTSCIDKSLADDQIPVQRYTRTRAIVEDFEQGRTLVVDGWILAASEVTFFRDLQA